MTDIVERLRQMATASADEAADEIERLREALDDLQMAVVAEAENGGDLQALADLVRRRRLTLAPSEDRT